MTIEQALQAADVVGLKRESITRYAEWLRGSLADGFGAEADPRFFVSERTGDNSTPVYESLVLFLPKHVAVTPWPSSGFETQFDFEIYPKAQVAKITLNCDLDGASSLAVQFAGGAVLHLQASYQTNRSQLRKVMSEFL